MSDRFHELTAFVAVAEAEGFSAASRRIGLSQPAISKAVLALERRLGVALLHRTTRRVSLTDQGRAYYERMRPLLDAMAEADGELARSTVEVSGLVRIAAPATLGRLHVLPLIPALLLLHPGLRIDLVLSDVVRDMVEDRIDLAIRGGPVDEPDAVVRRVGSTKLVCAGAPGYFARFGRPETPADLASHNCLVYGGGAAAEHWPFVGPHGPISVPVRGNLSSNSVEALRAGLLAGVGIGVMPRSVLADELARGEAVTVLDDCMEERRDVSLVWPQRRFVPARVRRTSDYFAAALTQRV